MPPSRWLLFPKNPRHKWGSDIERISREGRKQGQEKVKKFKVWSQNRIIVNGGRTRTRTPQAGGRIALSHLTFFPATAVRRVLCPYLSLHRSVFAVFVCVVVRASGTPINLGEKIVWNLEIWNSIKPNSLRQINLVAKIKNQINYLRTVRTVPFPRTSIGE